MWGHVSIIAIPTYKASLTLEKTLGPITYLHIIFLMHIRKKIPTIIVA
jgi:hypothetical protein